MEHKNPGPREKDKEQPKSRLKEKKQVVAGFVVFRKTEDGIKYLLLYKRGNYWNFPKGHFEAGETSFATALRETEEETGIKRSELRIIPNWRAYERFAFRAGDERIHDTVILYLAETKQPNVRISPREHSGFAWFLYHDALSTLGKKYVGTKRVLKQAQDFLRGPRLPAGRQGLPLRQSSPPAGRPAPSVARQQGPAPLRQQPAPNAHREQRPAQRHHHRHGNPPRKQG